MQFHQEHRVQDDGPWWGGQRVCWRERKLAASVKVLTLGEMDYIS